MNFPRKVYAIHHDVANKTYVGSSADVDKRFAQHLCLLRCGKHPVEDMQKDFDEFGNAFSFYILDEMFDWEDRKKEYAWMKKLNSHVRGSGYNYKDQAKVLLESAHFERPQPPPAPASDVHRKLTDRILRCDDPALLDLLLKIIEASE